MAVIRKLKKVEDDEFYPPLREIKKKEVKPHDESNWLISYADIMTLLCMFYVMMFSMSKLNTPEFEKMKKEVAEQLGGTYVSPTKDLGKLINDAIVDAGVKNDTTVTSDGVSVSIAFRSTLFFDSLSAEISKSGKDILNKIVTSIGEKQKANGKLYKFVVEGHTDSQPIVGGSYQSNWELSGSRATRVVRLFLDHGFKAQNLLAIGYADTQPVVADSRNPDGSWNEERLAKNRRVVLRVLLPDVETLQWKSSGPDQPVK